MSWLFSQALVEEYLGDTSLDGEQCALLSGNRTQQAYCAPDKMTEFSRLSRFGMTYKPLTDIPGEELSMSSVVAFHVKTLVQLEKAQGLTESDQECGDTWRGWLAKYDPDTSLWRTAQCSLLEDLNESLATLPRSGMTRNGLLWELPTLEPITNGTESGLLPTPTMQGLNGGSNSRKALKKRLLPTPDASQRGPTKNYDPQAKSQSGRTLQSYAAKFSNMEYPITGQLNPTWVEWLMGWPLGWTDLKPLETDKSHCAPQQHGDC